MPKPPDGGLGDRLKRLRITAKPALTQAELARRAHVSQAYLSELESGHGRRPSGRVLLALADALGVTIADLMGASVRPALPADDLPQGLAEFAAARNLPQGDVEMLAGIRFRGDVPRSPERWQHIYDAIRLSQGLDDEQA